MTRQERQNDSDMQSIESRIKAAEELIDELVISIKAENFTDQRVANGFALYKGILKSTMDILGGRNLTEPVLCQLIETAGYSTWRAIMGAKSEGQELQEFDNGNPFKATKVKRI